MICNELVKKLHSGCNITLVFLRYYSMERGEEGDPANYRSVVDEIVAVQVVTRTRQNSATVDHRPDSLNADTCLFSALGCRENNILTTLTSSVQHRPKVSKGND